MSYQIDWNVSSRGVAGGNVDDIVKRLKQYVEDHSNSFLCLCNALCNIWFNNDHTEFSFHFDTCSCSASDIVIGELCEFSKTVPNAVFCVDCRGECDEDERIHILNGEYEEIYSERVYEKPKRIFYDAPIKCCEAAAIVNAAEDELHVETNLGTIIAKLCNEPDYPGIYVYLERNDIRILLAWVESDQSGALDMPIMRMRLYADCRDDEQTTEAEISTAEFDEYFRQVANGANELI